MITCHHVEEARLCLNGEQKRPLRSEVDWKGVLRTPRTPWYMILEKLRGEKVVLDEKMMLMLTAMIWKVSEGF